MSRPLIGEEEISNVLRVLKSGNLSQGVEVTAFEKEFSDMIGCDFAVAVNSGTSALHLSLLAAGIGEGDEVIVPSFTFAATANSVALTGATPVFADINLETFNIDPFHVESLITSKTKAIQIVHLFGQPAQMNLLLEICKKYNLLLFEDAAQAHFAKFDEKYVGTFGIAASFSFYPTKNMTTGEGGLITTSMSNISKTCRILRNQGMEKKYQNLLVGYNNRMTEISAAIGRVQLNKVNDWTQKRQSNANFYSENLKGVEIPKVIPNASHVFHQYTIRIVDLDRDRFAAELEKMGIECGIYYPNPVHQLPSFKSDNHLPNTVIATQQSLSIPVRPDLAESELEKIVDSVNKISSAGS